MTSPINNSIATTPAIVQSDRPDEITGITIADEALPGVSRMG